MDRIVRRMHARIVSLESDAAGDTRNGADLGAPARRAS